jgi:predicted dehydrogenase
MRSLRHSRRGFLRSAAGGAAAAALLPDWLADLCHAQQKENKSPNDRLRLGSIGVGGQGTGIMHRARQFADQMAVCDVDREHAEKAKGDTKAEIYEDYRKLLERQDIDIVTIGTPDHWHTKICIDAMQAGKDVYCEKPLTLTIKEGQQLVQTVQETGRILQVGTQQRSEMGLVFLRAVATVRSGQLGKIKKVTVSLPLSTSEGGPFKTVDPPAHLNWDFWLGQAPLVGYCPERCHFQFRWWYEYSGGIITDWGAHHMDVAHWGLGVEKSGPRTIDGTKTKLPNIENGYNTPKQPVVLMEYPDDVLVEIVTGDEFVLFEGEQGRIRVNRGRVTGKAIEEQDADAGLRDKIQALMAELYRGMKTGNHMANFIDCVKSRAAPISDVVTQHRSVSACHLANISIRLGRKLSWDAEKEEFVGDDEANTMRTRAQRSPYEIST